MRLVAMVVAFAPSLALAAGIPTIVTCGGTGQSACTVCDLAKLAQNILNAGIYLAVVLSAVLFAWAGFMYLTNATNPSGVSRAKTLFGDVVIGLVIIVAAWLVIDIVLRSLTGTSLLPWSNLC